MPSPSVGELGAAGEQRAQRLVRDGISFIVNNLEEGALGARTARTTPL
jgi:hypothetical protein